MIQNVTQMNKGTHVLNPKSRETGYSVKQSIVRLCNKPVPWTIKADHQWPDRRLPGCLVCAKHHTSGWRQGTKLHVVPALTELSIIRYHKRVPINVPFWTTMGVFTFESASSLMPQEELQKGWNHSISIKKIKFIKM